MDVEISYLKKSEIDDQIRRTCEILGFPELTAKITWRWNSRLTRAIGRATLRKNHIELSTKLFNLLKSHERRDTIIHEVCHLVAHLKYTVQRGKRIRAHGLEWKSLMVKAGGTPKACSKKIEGSENLRRKTNRVTYHCKCQAHHITPRKAQKIELGAIWYCRSCKARLQKTPYQIQAPVRLAAETVKPPRAEDTRASLLAQIEQLKAENARLKAKN